MSESRAYLDCNATSPIRPEVVPVLSGAGLAGNASSVHREGRTARMRLEEARGRVAALVGARSDAVVFTSGGTEANGMALRPAALCDLAGRPIERLVVGATEHPSVLSGHRFAADAVGIVPVDPSGLVDLDRLKDLLVREGRPTLVSVQAANSETGVLQPITAIASIAAAHGAVLHVDAVQAAGRVALDMAALGAAALTLSAHKLGGPMGAGALVVAEGRAGPDLPLLRGGSQEHGLRAGTQNVPAAAGFGIAAAIAARDLPGEAVRLARLRDEAEAAVRRLAPEAVVFGASAPRLPNTTALAVPGLLAETALMALDLDGVAVSSGSACSSGKVGRSHVLAAMGVPRDLASGAIRVSFGWSSTEADLHRFVAAFEKLLQRLYPSERARAA